MKFIMILKRFVFSFVIVIFFCLIFGVHPSHANANDNSSDTSLVINPFSLPKVRVIPGQEFLIEIQKELFEEEIPINKQLKGTKVILEYQAIDEKGKVAQSEKNIPRGELFFKSSDRNEYLVVGIPSWDDIKDIRTQRWRGVLWPYKAQLKVHYQANKQENVITLPIEMPDTRWAFIWGLIAVFVSFFLIWAMVSLPRSREKREEKTDSLAKRFFLFPLRFTITPIGTYSISLTQILLWTYVTIFGIVYVYWLTGVFLEITPQLLGLLGIGGGTALGAKINALSRTEAIPSKYLDLVRRRPELRNLICVGNELSIFKFQILVFTLLTAYLALVEIIQTHAFPVMPENLITLMGLSSVVYLGNEVALGQKEKSKAEKGGLWKKVNEKIQAIEDKAKNKPIENVQQIEALKIKEVKELKRLLEKIYD